MPATCRHLHDLEEGAEVDPWIQGSPAQNI
jgi:hypothetical protein